MFCDGSKRLLPAQAKDRTCPHDDRNAAIMAVSKPSCGQEARGVIHQSSNLRIYLLQQAARG